MCINSYYELRDKIKENVNIAEYIMNNYPEIELKKKGKRYLGYCPFVKENNPSFNVYTDSNRFFCFGCREQGDLIQFVSKNDNISFQEACIKIADIEGIEYNLKESNPEHEAYKDKLQEFCKKYEQNLLQNEEALNYILCRGISLDTITNYRLGLVPNDERQHRKDCVYDIEGRISFPFLEYGNSKDSRCVGMAYRTIINGKSPKYTNDSNHSEKGDELNGVFNKGNYLFGFNQAKESIKKEGYAIVVEGYFDVLSLYESNIKNSVGICGVAFTEKQAQLLKRTTDNIYFFLDADKAGITAMKRVLPMLLEMGFNVKFVKSDKCNFDPADICIDLEFNYNDIKNYILKNSTVAVIDIIDDEVKEFTKVISDYQIKILNNLDNLFESIQNKNSYKVYKDYLYKKIGLK